MHRGKGLLQCVVTAIVCPRGAAIHVVLPGGARVVIDCRERIGQRLLFHGYFENAELQVARQLCRGGGIAFDVGANFGVFALSMAAGDPETTLVAVEPLPFNVSRLKRHIRENHLHNVEVIAAAAGARVGKIWLDVAGDPAYGRTASAQAGAEMGKDPQIEVDLRTLDGLWEERGRPRVSLVKIDVEGGELDVLRGAQGLLEACRPALLIEANSRGDLDRTSEILRQFGYEHQQPAGFEPWNYLYRSAS